MSDLQSNGTTDSFQYTVEELRAKGYSAERIALSKLRHQRRLEQAALQLEGKQPAAQESERAVPDDAGSEAPPDAEPSRPAHPQHAGQEQQRLRAQPQPEPEPNRPPQRQHAQQVLAGQSGHEEQEEQEEQRQFTARGHATQPRPRALEAIPEIPEIPPVHPRRPPRQPELIAMDRRQELVPATRPSIADEIPPVQPRRPVQRSEQIPNNGRQELPPATRQSIADEMPVHPRQPVQRSEPRLPDGRGQQQREATPASLHLGRPAVETTLRPERLSSITTETHPSIADEIPPAHLRQPHRTEPRVPDGRGQEQHGAIRASTHLARPVPEKVVRPAQETVVHSAPQTTLRPTRETTLRPAPLPDIETEARAKARAAEARASMTREARSGIATESRASMATGPQASMATGSRASIATGSRSSIANEPRPLDPRPHRREQAHQQPLSGIAKAARASIADETGNQNQRQDGALAPRPPAVAPRHGATRDPHREPARQQPLSGISTTARATTADEIPRHRDHAVASRHDRDPPLEPARQQTLSGIATTARATTAEGTPQHRDHAIALRHGRDPQHREPARQQPLPDIATTARATTAEGTPQHRDHAVALRHSRDPPLEPARHHPLSGIATTTEEIPQHRDHAVAPRHGVAPEKSGDPPHLEPMRQQHKEAEREAATERAAAAGAQASATWTTWIAWVLGWLWSLVLWLGGNMGTMVVAVWKHKKSSEGAKLLWGLSQGTLSWAWTACSPLLSKKVVLRLATAGVGLGATLAGVQFLADMTPWAVLQGAVCKYGPSAPLVGEWVGARCESGWGSTQQQHGPVLPSTRHVVVYPTYKKGPLVDAQACAQDLQEAIRSLMHHTRRDEQGTLHPRDQREAEDRMKDEARLVLAGLGGLADALVDAVKQVKRTQRDLLELLDYIVLYPGGGGAAWYERFMADFVAKGNSGSRALQKRVLQALSLLSQAQAERAKLVDALEAGITLPTLCDGKSQLARHLKTYSLQQEASQRRVSLADRQEKMARGARGRSREQNEEERKRQISLAALEKAEIDRLEAEAVSGPAILAAKVSLPCDCFKMIQDTANHFVELVSREMVELLAEVVPKLEGHRDDVASWGLFPQGGAIQEGEVKLVRTVEDYLKKMGSVYTRDQDGRG
ncbi:hypothetical protein QBC39DRAFT_142760 [Podospora conica]|nr:hypothetical protein QBC39DRAFT_142760 [Schizothecium conicum]